MVAMSCVVCGHDYLARAIVVRGGTGRYCSRSCANTGTFKNKKQSVELVARRAVALAGKLPPQKTRDLAVAARRGVSPLPESEARRLASLKASLSDPIKGPQIRANYSERTKRWYWSLTQEQRVELTRSRRKRAKPNSIERIVKEWLDAAGIVHEREHPILTYSVDFYVLSRNVVIECDGDYWHSLPGVVERDRRKNEELTCLGYAVVRLSERDIRSGRAIASIKEIADAPASCD